MEQDLLSVKDFAARAGVSVQAIYKRLNKVDNELNKYVFVIDGQKMLDAAALSLFADTVNSAADSTGCSTGCSTGLTVEYRYIETLEAELQRKNEQIEKLQQLLSQEQQLRLVADKRILLLEEQISSVSAPEVEQNTEQTEEVLEEEKPRHWWQKLFGR